MIFFKVYVIQISEIHKDVDLNACMCMDKDKVYIQK